MSIGSIVALILATVAAFFGWGKLQKHLGKKEAQRENNLAGVTELARRDRKAAKRKQKLQGTVVVIRQEGEDRADEIKRETFKPTPQAAEDLHERSKLSPEDLIARVTGEGGEDA